MWLPGSESTLAIVTDTFIKIYDLSVDSLSPSYYFIVFSEKIRDACFVVTEEVSISLCMSVHPCITIMDIISIFLYIFVHVYYRPLVCWL